MVRSNSFHPAGESFSNLPPILLGLEITPSNLQQRLEELAHWRRVTSVVAVGLIDNETIDRGQHLAIEEMLREAGAAAISVSPRRLRPLIALADRHAALAWRRAAAALPPHEVIWRRLPWQSAPWAIG
ncbi:MAG: hypothetical protein AAF589_01095 [Planctomycetota bacterium]